MKTKANKFSWAIVLVVHNYKEMTDDRFVRGNYQNKYIRRIQSLTIDVYLAEVLVRLFHE